jgi:membrane protein DedA with SNARE-associated domain
MSLTLASIVPLFARYGYFILILGAMAEGPIITIIAGFLASQGSLNILLAYLALIFGNLAGDMLYYSIGRFGKKAFIDKWGRWFGMTGERVEKIAAHFDAHSGKTLMFGKLTHVLGWPILMAAGISGMPAGRFLWFNFLGEVPKSLIFIAIGYYAGYAYQKIGHYLDETFLIIAAALIAAGIIWWFNRKRVDKMFKF